jgi:hypothetical protein
MKASEQPSPMRLACWAGIGSLISVCPMVLLPMRIFRLPLSAAPCEVGSAVSLGHWWPLLLLLAPMLIGFGISFRAEKRLRKGVKENAWSEMELMPLCQRLRSPVWGVLAGAQILGFCVLILPKAHGLHYSSVIWTLILPLQTLGRIYQIVKPVVSHTGLLEKRSLAPISSEHWGEPRQDRSLAL